MLKYFIVVRLVVLTIVQVRCSNVQIPFLNRNILNETVHELASEGLETKECQFLLQ